MLSIYSPFHQIASNPLSKSSVFISSRHSSRDYICRTNT